MEAVLAMEVFPRDLKLQPNNQTLQLLLNQLLNTVVFKIVLLELNNNNNSNSNNNKEPTWL